MMATEQKNDFDDEAFHIWSRKTFKKYPCFYCGINVTYEYHISEHVRKCREVECKP